MLYKLKYRDNLLSEKGNIPEEIIVRDIINKFVKDIPIEELKSLFGFKKEKLDYKHPFYDELIIEYSLYFNTDMRDMFSLREIEWASRYSDTNEPDKGGRWARIAYIGNKQNFGFNEETRRRQYFELAWVNQININEETHYNVTYRFPHNNKHMFETFEEAKEEVELCFKDFIKNSFK